MSRLSRRVIVGTGDGALELVIPAGGAVDIGLDWSRVLGDAHLTHSLWTSPDAANLATPNFTDTQAWCVLTPAIAGAFLRVRNEITASNGLQMTRTLLVRVRDDEG